jgi:uncharacterized protein DUF4231
MRRLWGRHQEEFEQAIASGTPRQHCDAMIRYASRKADKNKRRSRVATAALLLSTSAIPVAVIVADRTSPFWVGKVLVAVLAAVAAVLGGWVRIERPHERWSLYRGYQRRLEAERIRHEHSVAPYTGDDRDDLFAEYVAQRQADLHDEWAGLLPTSSEISALGGPGRM